MPKFKLPGQSKPTEQVDRAAHGSPGPHSTTHTPHPGLHAIAAVSVALLLAAGLAAPTTAQAAAPIPDRAYLTCVDRQLHLARGTQPTPSQLDSLTTIDCPDSAITSITGTGQMHHLKVMKLAGNKITTLPDLSGLPNLEILDASLNPLTSLSGLAHLPALNWLSINGDPISDLGPLAHDTSLQVFYAEAAKIHDISPLKAMSLHYLDMNNFIPPMGYCTPEHNQVTDLSPLAGMKNLTTVRMCGNNVASITPLAHHQKLTWIDLSFNGRITSLAGLYDVPKLGILNVAGNPITSALPLIADPSIYNLDINHAHLRYTAGLTSLKELDQLDVSNNQLADISALAKLPVTRTSHFWAMDEESTATPALAGVPTLVPHMAGLPNNPAILTPPKGAKVHGHAVTYPTKGTYTWTFHDNESVPGPSFDGVITVKVTG